MTEHDWKQIEAELDELRPLAVEQKHTAPPELRPALRPEDEAAILKHIAEALRSE